MSESSIRIIWWREAYSSSTVRKVLRERDGIAKDDVRQALCRMRDAGVRRVIVFPTHIIDGIENHRMKQEVTDCAPWFEDVRIADALLKTPEDYQRTAEALWESVAAEAGSSPVIFMGHGSEHAADESYERLECVLAQVTENDVYVATVEGSVTIDDVIGRMRASRHKSGRVLVAPFMLGLREIMPIMIWQERRIPLLPHSARRDMNRFAC